MLRIPDHVIDRMSDKATEAALDEVVSGVPVERRTLARLVDRRDRRDPEPPSGEGG